jgi:hypothetical protein
VADHARGSFFSNELGNPMNLEALAVDVIRPALRGFRAVFPSQTSTTTSWPLEEIQRMDLFPALAKTTLRPPQFSTPSAMPTRISVPPEAIRLGTPSDAPALNGNGRLVAFGSGATNLVSSNVQGRSNVYVRDTCNGTSTGCIASTDLVSLASDGSVGNCGSPGLNGGLSMSSDGRFVAFGSIATNLTPDDGFPACAFEDIFVRDTCFAAASGCTPSTFRVSVANTPSPGISANAISTYSAISADGHYLVFMSSATNLLPGATGNGHTMIYLAKTGF